MDVKTAIITGAGRGIGRATAIELSKRGYALVLVSRNEAELQETATLAGGQSIVAPADVTDPAALNALVENAVSQFGRVDAIVNNAGYAPLRTIIEMTAQEWRDLIDTNLSAAFFLSQAVWPIFTKQNAGVIVNLSSRAARDPFPGLGMYGSAKAALNLLTLSLAREGQPIGVRAHAIAPGAVETDMFRSLMNKEQVPTDKTLTPEYVARIIADCVTGELAYTSGEVIWIHKMV